MHGRPRKSPTPEEAAAAAVKAQKLRALQSQMLHNHSNKIYTKEAVDLSAQLLEINPESYTAWNYRKLAVEFNLALFGSDPGSTANVYEEELRLIENALRKNPKSYGAWHHRRWVISKGQSPVEKEMSLLGKFQSLDSRNFHAWNYRRFVAELRGRPEEDELDYTERLINNNFSNYSAWHNRSVLLSNLMRKGVKRFEQKEEVLEREYEFVRGAIFTDEDDQSGWFYHLWLLHQTITSNLPVLVSSWPAHGSCITLLSDKGANASELSYFQFDSKSFPLILYFDQPVTGVNSSTIEVEYPSNKNEDILWNAVSITNSCYSQVWKSQLRYPPPDGQPSSVIVTVGCRQGIISCNGLSFSGTLSLKFTLRAQPIMAEASQYFKDDYCSPKEEMFHPYTCSSDETNLLMISEMLHFKGHGESPASLWQMKVIDEEIENFHMLQDCKIGKLSLARLLTARDVLLQSSESSKLEDVVQFYGDLMSLNPQHIQYYKDQQSLALLQQITANAKAILSHCFFYRGISFGTNRNCVCLRLNKLSLSRIGSFERLLWVQILDLSENELHTLEGLETMQLLTHLFLSKNKLSSFTGLEPLKKLTSLKVLDISHNEIGAHPVDTSRYLYSSPFSQTAQEKWDPDDIDSYGYLEAYLFLKGLRLTQLDVAGNPIADDKFDSFLAKVLPTMNWLDGVLLA